MRRLVIVIVLALLLLAPAGARAAAAPCPDGSRCLTVRVPLDRSGGVAGTVPVRAAVVRGRDTQAAPLVLLTGGPGQAGVTYTEDWSFLLAITGIRRTFVTVDVRGAGDSGLLRCPAFERASDRSPLASAGGCGRLLGPRRAFYRSSDAAEDLEALRARLGVPKIALLAVSYGTRIAVEYARRHPSRTDRVILDSPVDDEADAFVGETFAAVSRVVRALCRVSCPGGGPQPVDDLRRLAARLRATPLRAGGRESMTEDALFDLLVSSDLDPRLMRRIPAAVRAALAGRPAALLALRDAAAELNSPAPVEEFSSALYAATLCEEAPLAWERTAGPATRRAQALAALAARPAGAFAPFSRTTAIGAGLLPLCESWPASTRPAVTDPPAATPAPVLVLSGELDLRTPLEAARRLAARLGNARVVVGSQLGHAVYGASLAGCATRSVAGFLRDALPACAR